jgi:PhzF family phenazine biosynthesis protein
MTLDLFQVDAFTGRVFKGNPACVIPLSNWLEDDLLLQIAQENAVAETAFFIDHADFFELRWFTPEIEVDLCGHATLATAHIIKTVLKNQSNTLQFKTQSGLLEVKENNGSYQLNFPSRPPQSVHLPENIRAALNIQPVEVLQSRDYVLVYESEEEISSIKIKREPFDQVNLDPGGVIVTAQGREVDFVSRFFTPQASILEDPVTGSAHCSLTPYWAEKLNKKRLTARQISARGGYLECTLQNERVLIHGEAQTYLHGRIELPQV